MVVNYFVKNYKIVPFLAQPTGDSGISNISLSQFRECRAYFVDEILIVFHPGSASLHFLDELSAWVFLSLDAGLSKVEIKHELTENQIDLDAELLDSAFDEIDKLVHPDPQNVAYQHEYQDLINTQPVAPTISTSIVIIELLGKEFQIYSNCDVFITYFKNFSLELDSFLAKDIDYHIEILVTEDGYALKCNGSHVTDIAEFEYIMPILMDHLQILAYQSADYLLAVHSAMLEVNGKGLMLPGQSGSGKSTLCISLLSQNYKCYSDEVAIISASDNQLMPLPLPVAIKSGSWDVIKNDFPDIGSLPIWSRTDGRRSKYIDLSHRYHGLPSVPISCIVFPHYQADIQLSEVVTLNSISTLEQLVQAGYQIRDNLSQDKVEQLLGWVANTPAYNLTYSSLDDAHKIINKLMGSA